MAEAKPMRLVTRPGFDWARVTWGKPDSPPTAICSYCAGALPEVPLMMWKDDSHAVQFCDACVERWFMVAKQ